MKKTKIALVIPTHYDIKSSLHNFLKIYSHIRESKKADVSIFTDYRNTISYDIEVVHIKGLDYRTPFEKAFLLLGLPRFYFRDLIKKLKGYDVIISGNPEFYWFAYQSYLASKKYGSKLIYQTSQTVLGFFLFRYLKFIPLFFARRACRHASGFIFTNPQARERYMRLGLLENDDKVLVTGHAVDTGLFRPMASGKKDKTVLLSVGGLYKIKGHHVIIKALHKLHSEGYGAELWIVGKGYYKKKLEKLAEKLNIRGSVKFLGAKGHRELAEIYNMSSIFVLANMQEITPAASEALACNLPVVVMECGGREFIIPDESCGLVSKKNDYEDMASKIKKLIDNPRLAKETADRGRKRIIGNFSVEIVAEKIYSLIDSANNV